LPRDADQDAGDFANGAQPSLFYFDQFFSQDFVTFYKRALKSAFALAGIKKTTAAILTNPTRSLWSVIGCTHRQSRATFEWK
jgi:hypothetical protein